MKNERVLVSWGGIGDALVCTPAITALKQAEPGRRIVLYCRKKAHLDVFKNNPNIDSLRLLRPGKMWRYPFHLYAYLFNRKLIDYTLLSFQEVDPPTIYNKHVKEIAADIFNMTLKSRNNEIYLTPDEDDHAKRRLAPYKNVVIMHIHSSIATNHLWDIENWNQLVGSLPDYCFIQIGQKDEAAVKGALDWRGLTTLRQAFAIVKNAKSFVGIDASMSHVTNAFNIPGVVLFGDSSPVYWGHDNNINIYKGTVCSPCYYYLWKYPCVYDHECMRSITVDEVREALIRQMEK